MQTKKVADLMPGEKVLMEDGAVRIVAKVGKGFATYRHAHTGKVEPALLIDWRDGDWSQVPRSTVVTLAPKKGKAAR